MYQGDPGDAEFGKHANRKAQALEVDHGENHLQVERGSFGPEMADLPEQLLGGRAPAPPGRGFGDPGQLQGQIPIRGLLGVVHGARL